MGLGVTQPEANNESEVSRAVDAAQAQCHRISCISTIHKPGETRMAPPPLDQAKHLIFGNSAAGHLHGAGARKQDIHFATDTLSAGPCSHDPEVHVALRRVWTREWEDRLLTLDDIRVALDAHSPLMVWASRGYSELVWLFCVLDGLQRLGADCRRVFLARPEPSGPPGSPFDATGGAAPEVLNAAHAAAQPLSEGALREGSSLWRAFNATSPSQFEAASHAATEFPESGTCSGIDLHAVLFPVVDGDVLRLSEFDTFLFRQLGSDSRPAEDLYLAAGRDGVGHLLVAFGTAFPIRRLRAWALRGAVTREVRSSDNPFARDTFRLTDEGRKLLDGGIATVADAPPLFVGGCAVNHPDAPWVLTKSAGSRFALHSITP